MPVSPFDGNRFLRGVVREAQRLEQAATVKAVALLKRGVRDEPESWFQGVLRGVPGFEDAVRRDVEQRLPRVTGLLEQARKDAVAWARDRVVEDGGTAGDAPVRGGGAVEGVVGAWRQYPAAAAVKVRQVAVAVYHNGAVDTRGKLLASQGLLNRELGSGMRVVPVGGKKYGVTTFTTMRAMGELSEAVMGAYVNSPSHLFYVPKVPTVCKKCQPWLGEVLSSYSVGGVFVVDYSPVRARYTVEEARAAGLWHPNCRHTAVVYTPGVTKTGVVESRSGKTPLWELEIRRDKAEHSARLERAVALTKTAADKANSVIKRFVALRNRKK